MADEDFKSTDWDYRRFTRNMMARMATQDVDRAVDSALDAENRAIAEAVQYNADLKRRREEAMAVAAEQDRFKGQSGFFDEFVWETLGGLGGALGNTAIAVSQAGGGLVMGAYNAFRDEGTAPTAPSTAFMDAWTSLKKAGLAAAEIVPYAEHIPGISSGFEAWRESIDETSREGLLAQALKQSNRPAEDRGMLGYSSYDPETGEGIDPTSAIQWSEAITDATGSKFIGGALGIMMFAGTLAADPLNYIGLGAAPKARVAGESLRSGLTVTARAKALRDVPEIFAKLPDTNYMKWASDEDALAKLVNNPRAMETWKTASAAQEARLLKLGDNPTVLRDELLDVMGADNPVIRNLTNAAEQGQKAGFKSVLTGDTWYDQAMLGQRHLFPTFMRNGVTDGLSQQTFRLASGANRATGSAVRWFRADTDAMEAAALVGGKKQETLTNILAEYGNVLSRTKAGQVVGQIAKDHPALFAGSLRFGIGAGLGGAASPEGMGLEGALVGGTAFAAFPPLFDEAAKRGTQLRDLVRSKFRSDAVETLTATMQLRQHGLRASVGAAMDDLRQNYARPLEDQMALIRQQTTDDEYEQAQARVRTRVERAYHGENPDINAGLVGDELDPLVEDAANLRAAMSRAEFDLQQRYGVNINKFVHDEIDWYGRSRSDEVLNNQRIQDWLQTEYVAGKFDPTGVYGRQLQGRVLKDMDFEQANKFMRDIVEKETGEKIGYFFEPDVVKQAYRSMRQTGEATYRARMVNEFVRSFVTPAEQQVAAGFLADLEAKWAANIDQAKQWSGGGLKPVTPDARTVLNPEVQRKIGEIKARPPANRTEANIDEYHRLESEIWSDIKRNREAEDLKVAEWESRVVEEGRAVRAKFESDIAALEEQRAVRGDAAVDKDIQWYKNELEKADATAEENGLGRDGADNILGSKHGPQRPHTSDGRTPEVNEKLNRQREIAREENWKKDKTDKLIVPPKRSFTEHDAQELIRWHDSLTPETRQYIRSRMKPEPAPGAPSLTAANDTALPAVERELSEIGLSLPDAQQLMSRVEALPESIRGNLQVLVNQTSGLNDQQFNRAVRDAAKGKTAGGIVTVDAQAAREVNAAIDKLGITPAEARDAVLGMDKLTPETRAVLRSRVARERLIADDDTLLQRDSILAMYDSIDGVIAKLPKKEREAIESLLPERDPDVQGLTDQQINDELGERFRQLAKRLSKKDERFSTKGVPDGMVKEAVETLNRMADDIEAHNKWLRGKREELEAAAMAEWRSVFGSDDAAIKAATTDLDLFNAGKGSGDTRQTIRRANVEYELKAGETPRKAGITIEPVSTPLKSAGKPTDAAEQAARMAGYRSLNAALNDAGYESLADAVRDIEKYGNIGEDAREVIRRTGSIKPTRDFDAELEAAQAAYDAALQRAGLSNDPKLQGAVDDAAVALKQAEDRANTRGAYLDTQGEIRGLPPKNLPDPAIAEAEARRELASQFPKISLEDAVERARKIDAMGDDVVGAVRNKPTAEPLDAETVPGGGTPLADDSPVADLLRTVRQRNDDLKAQVETMQKSKAKVKKPTQVEEATLEATQAEIANLERAHALLMKKAAELQGGQVPDVASFFDNLEDADRVALIASAAPPAPPNTIRAIDVMSTPGFKKAMPRDYGSLSELAHTYIPNAELLDFRRVFGDTTAKTNAFLKVMDKWTAFAKMFQIGTLTGASNDIIGNALTAGLYAGLTPDEIFESLKIHFQYRGAAMDAGERVKVLRVLEDYLAGETYALGKGKINTVVGELDDEAIELLAVNRGLYAREIGMFGETFDEAGSLAQRFNAAETPLGKAGAVLSTPARKAAELRSFSDNVFRRSAFKQGLKMGLSVDDAIRRAKNFFFDYSEVTKFESQWMRRAFTFYTFWRKSLTPTLKMLVKEPWRVRMMMLASGIGQDDGNSTDFFDRIAGTRIGTDADGNPVKLQLGSSLMHPLYNTLEAETLGDVAGNLLAMAAPGIRTPIELATGRDPFTGKMIRGYTAEDEQSGRTANSAPPVLRHLAAIPGVGPSVEKFLGYKKEYVGDTIKYTMDPMKRWIFTSVLPFGPASQELSRFTFADERQGIGYDLAEIAGLRVAKNYRGQKLDKAIADIDGMARDLRERIFDQPDSPWAFYGGNITPNTKTVSGKALKQLMDTTSAAAEEEADMMLMSGEAKADFVDKAVNRAVSTQNPSLWSAYETYKRLEGALRVLRAQRKGEETKPLDAGQYEQGLEGMRRFSLDE